MKIVNTAAAPQLTLGDVVISTIVGFPSGIYGDFNPCMKVASPRSSRNTKSFSWQHYCIVVDLVTGHTHQLPRFFGVTKYEAELIITDGEDS